MRYELKLHRLTLGILACILTIFVALLVEMRPTVADDRFEVVTSFIVIVLAASGFGFMGMVEGIVALQFGKKHKREFLSYLSLGLITLACRAVSRQSPTPPRVQIHRPRRRAPCVFLWHRTTAPRRASGTT